MQLVQFWRLAPSQPTSSLQTCTKEGALTYPSSDTGEEKRRETKSSTRGPVSRLTRAATSCVRGGSEIAGEAEVGGGGVIGCGAGSEREIHSSVQNDTDAGRLQTLLRNKRQTASRGSHLRTAGGSVCDRDQNRIKRSKVFFRQIKRS